MKSIFAILSISSLILFTAASANSATLRCASNEADIAKIRPFDTGAISFWNLDIPKQFEIETDGDQVKAIKYRFADLVREADITFESSGGQDIEFKESYEDLGKTSELYKGYHSTDISENSRKSTIKIRSKFIKWGMETGVDKLWRLTLDKSTLSGEIVAIKRISFLNLTKLSTKFTCSK